MTHNLNYRHFGLALALVLCLALDGLTQTLRIINNTHCRLDYKLFGSQYTPCGTECSYTGTVNPLATQFWKTPAEVQWKATSDVVHWRAFALQYSKAEKIGNCTDIPPFSSYVYVPYCTDDAEYSWNVDDETGNVTIVISPVITSRKRAAWAIPLVPADDGLSIILLPMIGLDKYTEWQRETRSLRNDGLH